MLQYTLKYESVRRRMPKFLCLFYSVFLSPPNMSLLGQQLQSLPRHAPSSGLCCRALRRPLQAPLQHRSHPLCCRAPQQRQTACLRRRLTVPPHAQASLFFVRDSSLMLGVTRAGFDGSPTSDAFGFFDLGWV